MTAQISHRSNKRLSPLATKSFGFSKISESSCLPAMEIAPASIERRKAALGHLGSLQDNFVVQTRDYKQQYAHLYFMRLMLMRPKVLKQAELKWGMN